MPVLCPGPIVVSREGMSQAHQRRHLACELAELESVIHWAGAVGQSLLAKAKSGILPRLSDTSQSGKTCPGS